MAQQVVPFAEGSETAAGRTRVVVCHGSIRLLHDDARHAMVRREG
jgi:hypothetical protein